MIWDEVFVEDESWFVRDEKECVDAIGCDQPSAEVGESTDFSDGFFTEPPFEVWVSSFWESETVLGDEVRDVTVAGGTGLDHRGYFLRSITRLWLVWIEKPWSFTALKRY